MKLLPEPGWLRVTCLVLSITLLTLSATILMYAYFLINEPQAILWFNYKASFSYLGLTKKFILEKTINGNSIYFYSDNFNGKPIEIENGTYLYPVLKKAFDDFEGFIAKKHQLNKPGKKHRERIVITFVRPEIHETHDLAHREPLSAAFAQIFSRNIYI